MHGQSSLICTNLVECKYWPVHTAVHLLVEGCVTICKHITSFSVIKVPAALLVWKPKMRASFKWIFFYFNKSHCYFYSSLFWKKDFLVRLRVCEDDGGGSREGDSFLWFFSPQVVSFISFVVCLDLKGGDRLQALFSPGWSHVSQPEYREWLKLEKPPFLLNIFYATTKKRRNRIVFWREIHYRWEKNYYPPSGAPTFSNGKKELWRNDYQYTTLLSSSLRNEVLELELKLAHKRA